MFGVGGGGGLREGVFGTCRMNQINTSDMLYDGRVVESCWAWECTVTFFLGMMCNVSPFDLHKSDPSSILLNLINNVPQLYTLTYSLGPTDQQSISLITSPINTMADKKRTTSPVNNPEPHTAHLAPETAPEIAPKPTSHHDAGTNTPPDDTAGIGDRTAEAFTILLSGFVRARQHRAGQEEFNQNVAHMDKVIAESQARVEEHRRWLEGFQRGGRGRKGGGGKGGGKGGLKREEEGGGVVALCYDDCELCV